MKFCSKCDNMFYMKINEKSKTPNKLVYYCRSCGNIDDTLVQEGVVVLETKLKNNEQTFNHFINKYTKLDPTLPRVYNIRCPNESCDTNKNTENKKPAEIIYMRYDDASLKYIYICTSCDKTWKTDDHIRVQGV